MTPDAPPGDAEADRDLSPADRERDPADRDLHPASRDPEHAGRDRDDAGRPRNARPRDALGRPLPRGAPGAERVPDDLSLPPADALALAQQLLDTGRPFHAHEVLEASWKQAPQQERDLWRGLAQVAVGLTHAQRGNSRGAVALLRRGTQRISEYSGRAPHGIDAGGIALACTELADRIAADAVADVAGADLRIRLTRG
ncbi:MAG TPA: DUF309 domain-containing protein [Streptosporangiaceae bacterium]|nr:DUF309 domain-containing protein [Streptosporangiaceae bacterium]